MSCQLGYSGHSGIAVGQDVLHELVFLFQCHVVDIMTEVTFSADVTSLATAVACLCNGFESPSVVNVYQNARGECMQRGVHFCRGHGGGGGL
jgi:hypothetical protein